MVSFLRSPTAPKGKVAFPSSARLVTVRFLDGQVIHGVTQSYSGARIGLFLVPTGLEDVERIYVPISAIRDVVSVKRLGEILTEQGMATPEMIERAIEQQKQLQDEQVGQILLKKKVISDEQLGKGLAEQKQRPERRIGDILLEQGFIDRVQLDEALEGQTQQRDRKLGEIMVDMGYATYKMIGIALAIQYNVPFMDLGSQTIDAQLRDLVPVKVASRWQIMPVNLQQGVLTIAMADPTDQSIQEEVRKLTGLTVISVVSTPQDIARTITRFYEP
jgi:type IV pilus assembly protein PilB